MIQGLEDFKTYNKAMDMGEKIWQTVVNWNYFEKDTIGKQLVRASDSVAANLSEGLGRYHFKEIKNFCYYSRGSLFETKTWLTKAHNRKMIDEGKFKELMIEIDIIGKMVNNYINSIGDENRVHEPEEEYQLLSPNTQVPTPNTQVPTPNPQSPIPNPQVLSPNT